LAGRAEADLGAVDREEVGRAAEVSAGLAAEAVADLGDVVEAVAGAADPGSAPAARKAWARCGACSA